MENLAKATITQATNIIRKMIVNGKNKPVMLWGPPGIGKSYAIKQLAFELAETHYPTLDNYIPKADGYMFAHGGAEPFIDRRISMMDAVDFLGVPSVDKNLIGNNITKFNPQDWMPVPEIHGSHGIIVLDEFFADTARATRVAAYQFLQDRMVGDFRLQDGWVIIAASNRAEDKAAVTAASYDPALSNRFIGHYEITLDPNGWVEWALNNGIAAELAAFVKFRPDLLHEYPDGGIERGRVAYATPRSMAAASDILDIQYDPTLEHIALEGCVGSAVAAELSGFLRTIRLVPDPDAILRDPDNAPIPTEVSTLYALAVLLGKRADQQSLGAVIRYLSRIEESQIDDSDHPCSVGSGEFVVLAVSVATSRDPAVKECEAYINFKIKFKDVFV